MWYHELFCVVFNEACLITTFIGQHLPKPPRLPLRSLRRVDVILPDCDLVDEGYLKGLAGLACISRSVHLTVRLEVFNREIDHNYINCRLPDAIEAFVGDLAPLLRVLEELHALGHSVDMKFHAARTVTIGDTNCRPRAVLKGLLSDRKVCILIPHHRRY
jgi:hypothetical protein